MGSLERWHTGVRGGRERAAEPIRLGRSCDRTTRHAAAGVGWIRWFRALPRRHPDSRARALGIEPGGALDLRCRRARKYARADPRSPHGESNVVAGWQARGLLRGAAG